MKGLPFFHRHTPLQRLLILKALAVQIIKEFTESGSIVSFITNMVAALRWTAQISPVQDLHGQDSPYPAGGGKNKFKNTFDGWTKPSNYYIYPVSLSEGDWTIKATLRNGKTAITGCVVGFARDGTSYPFVGQASCITTNGDAITTGATIQSGDNPVLVFYGTEENFSAIIEAYEIQLESGSTATAYAPYSNLCPITGWTKCNVYHAPTSDPDDPDKETRTISWQDTAGTVYGGTLTDNGDGTGTLVVVLCKITIPATDWTFQASINAWYVPLSDYPDVAQIGSASSDFVGYCDKYKIVGYSAMVNQNIQYSLSVRNDASVKRIYVKTDGTNTVEPGAVDVVLKLATPVSYTLPMDAIESLLGQNNLWADTGNMSVTYKKKC